MKASRGKLRLATPGQRPDPPKLVAVSRGTDPVILEFQADAIELEDRPPPRLARMTLYAVVWFLACAVLWASVSTIDEIVVAPGKLVTTQPMLVVQPLETSVIRSISVRPGDIVHAGQTLATLDPTVTEADVEQLQAKIDGLYAKISRLDAELAGRTYVAPPEATADEMLQARLSGQRKAFYDAKLRDFDTRIAFADATLAAAIEEEGVLTQRLAGLHEIDDMRTSLLDQKIGSRLSYLQGRDLSLSIEATLRRVRGNQVETRQTLEQGKAEREAFIGDFGRTSMETLVELRDARAAAAEDLKKAELRKRMAVLVAPADAAVLDIAQRSIGSVVREAETLFTLVPLNVPLEAEVSVAAKDIGYLKPGDPARIKFDAFPFQKYGTADGEIRVISQDAFAPETKSDRTGATAAPIYKARIDLDAIKLRSLPKDFQFLPGMTVQVEIKAGQRRLISYFLYPLVRGLDESFHEP